MNFRLYAIGALADDATETLEIMAKIYISLHTNAFIENNAPLPFPVIYDTDDGQIAFNEIRCITTADFKMSIFYFSFMPTLSYIHVWMLKSTNFSSPSKIQSELFALAEEDGEMDMRLIQNLKKLEEIFLGNIEGKLHVVLLLIAEIVVGKDYEIKIRRNPQKSESCDLLDFSSKRVGLS